MCLGVLSSVRRAVLVLTLASAGADTCFACKAAIGAAERYVVAKDKKFHDIHFTCVTCNKSLAGAAPARVAIARVWPRTALQVWASSRRTTPSIARMISTASSSAWRVRLRTACLHAQRVVVCSPACAACNSVIKGAYVTALGQSWHPEHFVCTECNKPFEGSSFHKHGDKPYCQSDFNKLFGTACSKCSRNIDGLFGSARRTRSAVS